MATLTAILIPFALLHATSGVKLYTSKAFDIIGTDVINDVFRVYAKYIRTAPLPSIPDLARDFPYPKVQGGHVWVNATHGTLQGELTLEKSEEAKMQFDPEANVITAKFPVTFRNLQIQFSPFYLKFGNLKDQGEVVTSPKTNSFQLTMSVIHKSNPGQERCRVTLENAKVVELDGFKTTAKNFGDPNINNDIDNIVKNLFGEKILGSYIDAALKQYAAQTAPKVFRYCKYVDFNTIKNDLHKSENES